MNSNIKKLISIALYIAMFTVLSIYGTINIVDAKLTLQNFPLLLGAITLGPTAGAIIGFTGALLNQLLTYGFTPTTLIWVLPHTIFGLLTGLVFENKKLKADKGVRFWVTIIVLQLILTLLNTVALFVDSVIFGYYSFLLIFGSLIARLMLSVLTSIVYCCILPPVLKVIKKIH